VPNFDGQGSCNPVLEVYEAKELVFSSRGLHSSTDNLILRDPYNIIFRIITSSEVSMQRRLSTRPVSAGEADDSETPSPALLPAQSPIPSPSTPHPPLDTNARLIPLSIEKDVELRIYHAADNDESRMQLMLSFAFNTGFMGTGLTRIRRNELDLSNRDNGNYSRLSKDFSIDLIFSEDPSTFISYEIFLDRSFTKGLAKVGFYQSMHKNVAHFRS
jgi:hypothetical protein